MGFALCEPVGSTAVISVNTQAPGPSISEQTLGLSYETSRLLPDKNGQHYFRPDNKPLVTLFKLLGIKSLRIGGNSVDAPQIPIPSEADIASLCEFAKATGVKLIYSVRLENGAPAAAASVAKLFHDQYAAQLDTFAIGNEPYYYKDYVIYRAKWAAIHDAMVAVFPDAKFSGPDQNYSPDLCKNFARDFGALAGGVVQISQHLYAFGCSYKNPHGDKSDVENLIPFDGPASRERMLSQQAYGTYEKSLKSLTDACAGKPLSFRLSETNSYWFSGLKGTSDSYASALWATDYLYWWAEHGAAGLNFHTGDFTGGALAMPCRYAAFVTSDHGYEVRPLGYAMKLFDLGGHGKTLLVNVPTALNLVVYATLSEGKTVSITLINKSHGDSAMRIPIQIKLDAPTTGAKAIFLSSTTGDLAGSSSEVRLGGEPILDDGTWNGQWQPLASAANATIEISMPPASVAVVQTQLQ